MAALKPVLGRRQIDTNHSALFISQTLRLQGLFPNLSFFFMPGPAIWNMLPQK
jgi:hypothetical protein